MANKLTFIEFNDLHWRGSNPEARTDNYMLALKAKLAEIAELAHELGAAGILIPGDLVDVPGISLPVLTELDYALGEIPCCIYAIAGQHDEWDHSPASLSRAPFGHQAKLEYIHDVAAAPYCIRSGNIEVVITGKHYDSSVESEGYYEPQEVGCAVEEVDAATKTVKIHLAHGLVVTEAPGFEMKCTPLKKLKTSANILCVGDYHPGIGIQKLNNASKTLVINPGALGRVKATTSDMNRPIQVAIIDIWDTGKYEARLHTLSSAKPGIEVLSREKIEIEQARDDKVSEYLRLLRGTGKHKAMNVVEMMSFIAEKEGLSQKVKAEALKRLGIAREQVG